MKVVLAPDSFKGSLSAADAADAMARGVAAVAPEAETVCCPIADGGEGTAAALTAAAGGRMHRVEVTGPLPGQRVDASWAELPGETAVIEMAEAAGLGLVPEAERDTRRCTTYGVGELIRRALDAGARSLLLTLGGSATTDGGTGCVQALGVRFTMADGRTRGPVDPPLTGADLPDLTGIDRSGLDPRLQGLTLNVACDVTNPLFGPDGAAHVYGPQKGADAAAVSMLDAGLRHLAELAGGDPDTPGAGAAGGMGYAGFRFLSGRLRPGIDLVLEAVRFAERVRNATHLLTGEGRMDGQSLRGKAVLGVANATRAANPACRIVALVGSAEASLLSSPPPPLDGLHLIAPDVPAETSIREAATFLEAATAACLKRHG